MIPTLQNVLVESADVLYIVTLVANEKLSRSQCRLGRVGTTSAGDVYVYCEEDAAITRWTDSRKWMPGNTRNNTATYIERATSDDQRLLRRQRYTVRLPESPEMKWIVVCYSYADAAANSTLRDLDSVLHSIAPRPRPAPPTLRYASIEANIGRGSPTAYNLLDTCVRRPLAPPHVADSTTPLSRTHPDFCHGPLSPTSPISSEPRALFPSLAASSGAVPQLAAVPQPQPIKGAKNLPSIQEILSDGWERSQATCSARLPPLLSSSARCFS